jgi:hypothetical protein
MTIVLAAPLPQASQNSVELCSPLHSPGALCSPTRSYATNPRLAKSQTRKEDECTYQHPDEGRLARPVLPEHHHDLRVGELALLHVQCEAALRLLHVRVLVPRVRLHLLLGLCGGLRNLERNSTDWILKEKAQPGTESKRLSSYGKGTLSPERDHVHSLHRRNEDTTRK